MEHLAAWYRSSQLTFTLVAVALGMAWLGAMPLRAQTFVLPGESIVLSFADDLTCDEFEDGPMSDDGTMLAISGGLHYLAISGIGNVPQAAGMADIFALMTTSEISGPDGAGGMLPIAGLLGEGGFGSYTIALDGASFVPAPSVMSLLVLGAFAGPRRRRQS